jgi:hypothetical protein
LREPEALKVGVFAGRILVILHQLSCKVARSASRTTHMLAPDNATSERLRKLEALARRPGTVGEGAAARAAISRIQARFRPPVPPTIVGLMLRLDRTCDRRWGGCCDRRGVICEGTGPHGHALRCARCGSHRGWLKRTAADLLTAMLKDGRLSERPILRDAGIVP